MSNVKETKPEELKVRIIKDDAFYRLGYEYPDMSISVDQVTDWMKQHNSDVNGILATVLYRGAVHHAQQLLKFADTIDEKIQIPVVETTQNDKQATV